MEVYLLLATNKTLKNCLHYTYTLQIKVSSGPWAHAVYLSTEKVSCMLVTTVGSVESYSSMYM